MTGSVGKSSVKEAIYWTLRKEFKVRRNLRNYNNELGVPLTILGLETGGCSLFGWFKNFLKAIFMIIWRIDYPEILILELAVDKPGDMKYLLNFLPVKIGVFTAIGEFPVHLEFFPEKEKLIEEKAALVKSLPKNGTAILNYDDLSVRMVGDELPEDLKTIYYGYGQGADLKIVNYEFKIDELKKGEFGINFKLDYQGSIVPIKLKRILGKQQTYAVATAAAVGLALGLNLVNISTALRKYRTLPGRTKMIRGIKETWIIDDSYNASPLATLAALEILGQFPSFEQNNEPHRKIAVLADMLELGNNTELGHRQVGEKAAGLVDLLFTVGNRARFIADQAQKSGLAPEKIFQFSEAKEAALALQKKIQMGDIILVKGSRTMHMEKVVKEIMLRPEKAGKLLVSK